MSLIEKIASVIVLTSILSFATCVGPGSQRVKATSVTHTKAGLSKSSTVKFLWREERYDQKLKGRFSTIIINENFCKTMTEQEKAALAYVATFVGNECWWENDEPNADRTNLKCKILTALDLGCQGSEKHLLFLRKWFKNDKNCLKKLEYIPTTPYTATIQDTFEKIDLTVTGNIIKVWYKVSGVNLREEQYWEWTETDYFKFEKDDLQLIKVEKSKTKE